MASVEILAKLCAGTSSLQFNGGARGFPVGGQLGRSELAGLLAGLTSPQMHYALAKYAGDEDSAHKLFVDTFAWLKATAKGDSDWRGTDTARLLTKCAISETISPSRHKACKGRGFVGSKPCTVCDSTGVKYLSGRQIALQIGIDPANYRRAWQGRYEIITRHLQAIDYQIRVALRANDREKLG